MATQELDYAPPATTLEIAEEVTQAPQEPPKAPAKKSKGHLEFVVVIRALAMVIIIAEHVIYPQINNFNTISTLDWWIASTLYLIGKTGSPLFTMISGLLLLNPKKADQPVGIFFKKRFFKVLIPFTAWSLIYMAYIHFWNGTTLNLEAVKYLLVTGPVYGHLWFLQMILGLYLITPILRVYVKAASRENLTYFIVVWFLMTCLFPLVDRFFGVRIGIYLYVTTGYVGFFILGIYLKDVTLKGKHLRWAIFGVGFFWLLSQFLTHSATVQNGGEFDHFYAFNTSFNIVPLSILCFLVLKSVDWEYIYALLPQFKWVIKKISMASLGIYCVHQLVIDEFRKGVFGIVLDENTWHFLISVPIVTAVVMIISALVTLELQKIPIIKQIVP